LVGLDNNRQPLFLPNDYRRLHAWLAEPAEVAAHPSGAGRRNLPPTKFNEIYSNPNS